MIPDLIRYTGLDIDPQAILNPRKHRGPIPSSWTRVRFEHAGNLHGFERWVVTNTNGRFAYYTFNVSTPDGLKQIVVVAFEDIPDAVLFRLKEGETAWRPEGGDAI